MFIFLNYYTGTTNEYIILLNEGYQFKNPYGEFKEKFFMEYLDGNSFGHQLLGRNGV
jgi:hypothetical protein